jgi:elongation factor P hydroxylase
MGWKMEEVRWKMWKSGCGSLTLSPPGSLVNGSIVHWCMAGDECGFEKSYFIPLWFIGSLVIGSIVHWCLAGDECRFEKSYFITPLGRRGKKRESRGKTRMSV